jgi:hypothetical protein
VATRSRPVIVIVIVDVIDPVIVAALVNGNEIVGVIDAVDAQRSIMAEPPAIA